MANTSPQAQRPATTKDASSAAAPAGSFPLRERLRCYLYQPGEDAGRARRSTCTTSRCGESYHNAAGEWEHTHSLRAGDLLQAAYALLKCYDFIAQANGPDEEERQ